MSKITLLGRSKKSRKGRCLKWAKGRSRCLRRAKTLGRARRRRRR